MEHIDAYIAEGLAALGLIDRVLPEAPERLDAYCRLLLEANQVMNLTAITQPRQVAALHMLDSAALLCCPGVSWERETLLDVGTGAGFPGLVVKILVPDLRVTLLDSQRKRVLWLERTAAALGVEIVTICGRAEELAREGDYREGFGLVTARAVAELRTLCELCLPFVRAGGRFLAMKGPDPAAELDAARPAVHLLGGAPERVWTYPVPGGDATHSVVVLRKDRPTEAQFPRKWKKIRTEPL